MSDVTDYAVAAGFIQFDPKEKEINGKQVRELAIRAVGTQKRVYVTVWPQHAGVSLEKGMFVVAEGKFQKRTGNEGQVYNNLSASSLVVLQQVEAAERETVNTETAPADDDIPF